MGNRYAGYNPQTLGEDRDRLLDALIEIQQAAPVAWLLDDGDATSRRHVMEAAKANGIKVTPLYALDQDALDCAIQNWGPRQPPWPRRFKPKKG